jgi:hypothetical protein
MTSPPTHGIQSYHWPAKSWNRGYVSCTEDRKEWKIHRPFHPPAAESKAFIMASFLKETPTSDTQTPPVSAHFSNASGKFVSEMAPDTGNHDRVVQRIDGCDNTVHTV